jgi:hypothetical protein
LCGGQSLWRSADFQICFIAALPGCELCEGSVCPLFSTLYRLEISGTDLDIRATLSVAHPDFYRASFLQTLPLT